MSETAGEQIDPIKFRGHCTLGEGETMSETDETTDLRALDRDLADLMGWTPETFSDGVYWRDRAGVMWPYLPNFSGCKTLDPHVQWEGFGLLVEEALRRGWEFSAAVWGRAGDGVPQAFITWRGRRLNNPWERAGSDIRHAFALAMRDALRAGNEAP